ncbi:hypothetical protein LZ198_15580 [Myxococcus sp. K15C18031901]|uniref:hypothetical protein n=1 Tax=Myxococcus dinghuensis TaxID=2906761 RepID=UPI0020A825BC|nr:hypothetical protein [Myxococcus dinghuensis]MCP3100291.1 hypothetical protein [Myxococcus dinghuensis]
MKLPHRAHQHLLHGPSQLRREDLPRPVTPPEPVTEAREAETRPRRYAYERLMTVDLRHTYFNASEGRCRALVGAPTAATRGWMRDQGLLFLQEEGRFSVLYDFNRRDQLLSALARRHREGEWSWLSFVLVAETPYFVNLTDLPSDFQPLQTNLYFDNTQAHFLDAPPESSDQGLHCEGALTPPALLNPGSHVTAASGLRVVQAQLQVVLVSEDVDRVVVDNLAGAPVLCKPCSIPVGLLRKQAPYLVTCEQVQARRAHARPPDLEQRLGRVAYLDLVSLPEGRYVIRQEDRAGRTLHTDTVVYTQPYPTPLCFVNLLLDKPEASASGLYPVCDLEQGVDLARIVPLELELRFERRQTRWIYYAIPPPGVRYEALDLVDTATSGGVTFSGPSPAHVAGAGAAYRFIADAELPLEEVSTFRFELRGAQRVGSPERTLMARVPVASPALVLPREGSPPGRAIDTRPTGHPPSPKASERHDYSDIYLNL